MATEKRTVVVVGAGMSGLSCAHSLRADHGVEDVLVLEARDRTGGRVHTRRGRGAPLEMGAEFIHGSTEGHTIFAFAQKHGLLGQELHLVPNENTVEGLVAVGELRRPDGSTLDPEAVLEANRAYGQTGDGIAEEAEALFARAKTGGQRAWKDKSLADFFESKAGEALRKAEEEGRTGRYLSDLRCAFVALRRAMESYASNDLEQISAELWGSCLDLVQEDVALDRTEGGLGAIVGAIAEQLGEDKIRLRCEVKEVELKRDSVLVRYSEEGSGKTLEVEAKFVVCTIPLGVLKARHRKIFKNPPLPNRKIQALGRMCPGHQSKIFLEWPEPFWTSSSSSSFALTLAWTEEELSPDWDAGVADWAKGVHSFTSVHGHDRLLVCWVLGERGRVADTKPDQEVLQVLGTLLRRFSTSPDVPLPSRVIRHAWTADPFTLGTWCTPSVLATEEDLLTLAAPLPPPSEDGEAGTSRIMFAGEAAEPENWSNLHGARLSGLREARRIAGLLQNDVCQSS